MNHIVLVLNNGTKFDMGVQYGKHMKDKLHTTLKLLTEFFVEKNHIPEQKLVIEAKKLYDRFPLEYQFLIDGMAEGAGLSKNEAKMLNAMEIFPFVLRNCCSTDLIDGFGDFNSSKSINNTNISSNADSFTSNACSFIAIHWNNTVHNATIVGRNYDYSAPFDKIARYLTVTIFQEPNRNPTAIISMPGELYCPSCVSKGGMFLELNSALPSGGKIPNYERTSMLSGMLQSLQNSRNFEHLNKHLLTIGSDFSLIVNAVNKDSVKSFEYSSSSFMRPYTPNHGVFVSTNFFLNKTWPNLPVPTDDTTWLGVTRKKNLENLASLAIKHGPLDAYALMKIMDIKFDDGGATVNHTIYQIVYDAGTDHLYLKVPGYNTNWSDINLSEIWGNTTELTII